jgi:hypothetical protein
MELINFKSLNRYKEMVHEEVVYVAPQEIMDRISTISKERDALLSRLNKK